MIFLLTSVKHQLATLLFFGAYMDFSQVHPSYRFSTSHSKYNFKNKKKETKEEMWVDYDGVVEFFIPSPICGSISQHLI